MPTGRTILRVVHPGLNPRKARKTSADEAKKPKYLKIPRMPRLPQRLRVSHFFLALGFLEA